METQIQNVVIYYDCIEIAQRRGGEVGQDPNFSDVHRTWIRWFKRRQAVPGDHLRARMAFDEQDSLHTTRPV